MRERQEARKCYSAALEDEPLWTLTVSLGISMFIITARKGLKDMVKFLLESTVDFQWGRSGRTPLPSATVNGHEGVIKQLCKTGTGCTVLLLFNKKGRLAKADFVIPLTCGGSSIVSPGERDSGHVQTWISRRNPSSH